MEFKEYKAPEMEVIKLEHQAPLLNMSDGTNDGVVDDD